MAHSKNPIEIVTDKDLDLVLKNTTFDSATFLRLYAEWKATGDTHTFASLRKMHEDAGYNNKNNVFGAEQEMHQIATIVQKYQDGKNQVTATTATAAGGLNNTVVQNTNNGVKEVKETLAEINPENLEKAITISEKFINILPTGETQTTLRGIHGAVIFQILRDAGHNLIMQGGQITIMPKPGTDVINLQEKLQTLVNTGRISLDTIKIGMLYSSPTFAEYAKMKKTKDASGKEIIDPKASTQDLMTYLTDLQKAGNKSGDISSILGSQAMLQGVNMQKAIKGFQDMGQIGEWAQKNQQLAQNAANAGSAITTGNNATTPQAPTMPNTVPSKPSNYLTGQLVGNGGQANNLGKGAGEIIGGSFKGFWGGIGDLLKAGEGDGVATLGIGAAILYGIWKMFHLGPAGAFSFGRGLGAMFGLGALNNANGIKDVLTGVTPTTVTPVSTPVPAVTSTPAANNNTQTNTPQETPTQKLISDSIRQLPEFKDILDPAKLATKKKNGNMEDYLKFINTNLKDTNSDIFVQPKNDDHNIFSDKRTLDPSITLPDNLDPSVFKSIMRTYLTGTYISINKLNDPTVVKIVAEKISKIPKTTTTLHDAIVAIH